MPPEPQPEPPPEPPRECSPSSREAGRLGEADEDDESDAFPRVRLRLPPLCAAGVEVPPVLFHCALGFVIGLFSLLTSTGGPMIALPLFFRYYPRLSPLRALVLAQSLCIPNGICAFLVAALRSSLDLGLSAAISVAVATGVPIGHAIAKRLRPNVLRALVGIMLIIVGGSAVAKVLLGRVADPVGEDEPSER